MASAKAASLTQYDRYGFPTPLEGYRKYGALYDHNVPARLPGLHNSAVIRTYGTPYGNPDYHISRHSSPGRSFIEWRDDIPRASLSKSAIDQHHDGARSLTESYNAVTHQFGTTLAIQSREAPARVPCAWPGCGITFSRKADAIRHMTSRHRVELMDCDIPRCSRVGENGFARKDHLLEHKRGYHGLDIPKRRFKWRRDGSPTPSSHKSARISGFLSRDDHLVQPATTSGLPSRPFDPRTAEMTSKINWELYNSPLPEVPLSCSTEMTSAYDVPGAESPSDIVNTSRNWTPGSNSAQSTIESEGERSFINSSDYEDPYSPQPREHALALDLARLSLQKCIVETKRMKQKTTIGSSEGSAFQSSKESLHSSYSTSLPCNRSSSKRALESGNGSGDWDETNNDKNMKKPCRSALGRTPCTRLLACPYYRFDVSRYSERNTEEIFYRGCSSVCLRDISRLKQHLYRVHRRPDYYCGSCYCTFSSQSDLDSHTRLRPSCENEPSKYEEKIHRDQMNAIKRRTMGTDPVEEWFRIYRILFPESSLPPVSYVYADGDSSIAVQEYLAYFQAEAPFLLLDLVRRHIEGRMNLNAEHHEILNEAFEYAAAQVVSRLRPRIDESGLPRSAMQGDTHQTGGLDRLTDVSQITSNTEEFPPLAISDQTWSIIHARNGDWPDVGQEDWLNLELADLTDYEVGAPTVPGAA